MVDFRRKSMELKINHTNTVKNFHSVDLGGISGVGWENLREIGWGGFLL